MFKAWGKGISPYEFRKCLVEDIYFLQDCENSISEKQQQQQRDLEIQKAMNNLPR